MPCDTEIYSTPYWFASFSKIYTKYDLFTLYLLRLGSPVLGIDTDETLKLFSALKSVLRWENNMPCHSTRMVIGSQLDVIRGNKARLEFLSQKNLTYDSYFYKIYHDKCITGDLIVCPKCFALLFKMDEY